MNIFIVTSIVIITFLFIVTVYLIMTLILMSRGEKPTMKRRFSKYFKSMDIEEVQDLVLKERLENEKKKKTHGFNFASKELSNYLLSSGVKLSATEYITSWTLLTLVPMLVALILHRGVITATAAALIGFAIPPIIVQQSRKKREEQFNKQLSESLAIMSNSLKAWFSFQQAMESIASEMQPPISAEFSKTLREIQYGVSMEDALNHMVERVKNKDLDLLVSAVMTATQVGGNLSEILEVIAETVRDRIKIKADVRVLTASGRISGLIIGLLPIIIILIVMLVNPDYFASFFESQIGKIMMVVSVVLEATGFLVINKIVDIQY